MTDLCAAACAGTLHRQAVRRSMDVIAQDLFPMPLRPLLFAALLLLAACATGPTPYAPAQRAGGPGFTETRIESDRYRVNFHADSGGMARASDLVLLRAAELTLQNGNDWFAVTQRETEGGAYAGGARPNVSIGVGGANYGGHTSIGTGVGVTLGGNGGSNGATATLEIRMGKGPKPADVAVYDARDVQRSIGPRA